MSDHRKPLGRRMLPQTLRLRCLRARALRAQDFRWREVGLFLSWKDLRDDGTCDGRRGGRGGGLESQSLSSLGLQLVAKILL